MEKTAIESLDFSDLAQEMQYNYDYELNKITMENKENVLNSKIYYYDKQLKSERIINFNNYEDRLKQDPFIPLRGATTANCFKRLVSKKKIRFQNEEFDLDMAYITERVIAMGFPSFGYETLFRNSVHDVIEYFQKYHESKLKVYNLCLEKSRIYHKSLFPNCDVGLFPSNDHNPCPIKLILDFCVDISLYLMKNPKNVAAIHCKAGKGRTGVMICCYLIFSGLCNTSDQALDYYGRMRTRNNRGVTIASQIRYIKYFEVFLSSNFSKPYYRCIPKLIKEHLIEPNEKTLQIKNLLINLQKDSRYYISANTFKLKQIKIGPLSNGSISLKINNFCNNSFNFPDVKKLYEFNKKGERHYCHNLYDQDHVINSDIKIVISESIDCYMWMNLWYSTLEYITDNFTPAQSSEINPKENDNKTINENEGMNSARQKKDFFSKYANNNKFIILDNEDIVTELRETFKKSSSITSESSELKITHNANLNEIIDQINKIKQLNNQECIDRSNIRIILNADALDKFKEKKKMSKIKVEILYSLLQ